MRHGVPTGGPGLAALRAAVLEALGLLWGPLPMPPAPALAGLAGADPSPWQLAVAEGSTRWAPSWPSPRRGGAAAVADDTAGTGGTAVDDGAAPRPGEADLVATVDRARSGDAEAFAAIYDRYVDMVYRYVYYRVGNHAQAEDLTSETFLRALRRIDTFTWQGKDVGAWLVTIARNLVADHFKSGRFRLEVTTPDMVDADRAEDGPEGAVLDALANEVLVAAVKQLNPAQQECVVLRFLQGLSVAETALVMGKNEGAIKTLQYRAVRALARLVPEDIL